MDRPWPQSAFPGQPADPCGGTTGDGEATTACGGGCVCGQDGDLRELGGGLWRYFSSTDEDLGVRTLGHSTSVTQWGQEGKQAPCLQAPPLPSTRKPEA